MSPAVEYHSCTEPGPRVRWTLLSDLASSCSLCLSKWLQNAGQAAFHLVSEKWAEVDQLGPEGGALAVHRLSQWKEL